MRAANGAPAGAYAQIAAVRTPDTESLADVDAVAVAGNVARVDLPPQSVTTVHALIR